MSSLTVGQLGEKELIRTIVRPIFNPSSDPDSVGDDCALFRLPSGTVGIASTDRVPADLISFRTGVIDAEALGRYLGVLNLSDLAACGGHPVGVLFNCGLPPDLPVSTFADICRGLANIVVRHGATVFGGDITSAAELSLSATAIGWTAAGCALRRSGARPGDSVFITRSPGLTPVALDYCLRPRDYERYAPEVVQRLVAQFSAIEPELDLGQRLARSNVCSSCMDNTDGIGQSLAEIGSASSCGFELLAEGLQLDAVVTETAARVGDNALTFALGPGADFGLVGTLSGSWSPTMARAKFGPAVRVIGSVKAAPGISIRDGARTRELRVRGWNYFAELITLRSET